MRQTLLLLINELRGAWRYRWRALAVAWCICMLGWFSVLSMPHVYEARAQVFVDAQSRLAEVMGQVGVSPGVGSRVFVVRQAMLGRPQLERVAAETGFDERATTEEEEEALYLSLRENIMVTTGRTRESSNLYTISFEDSDRDMALSVVHALLDAFVEDVLKLKEQGTDEVDDYLSDQLGYYSGLLQESEKELAEFKKRNVGLLPGESGGIFTKLQLEMDALRKAELDLKIEQDRRAELRRQLSGENPMLPEDAETAENSRLPGGGTSQRIEDLEEQLSELRLTYTDRHPDVIAINEQLVQLRIQLEDERHALLVSNGGMEGVANATNPVYQTVQIALNEASVRIAGLESQVTLHRVTVAELRSQIDTIPEIEAELTTLTRDYNQYQALYNEIMVRKERERMGKVDGERDVVTFNVTEPPTAALEPVGPKRTVMLVGIFLLGLGAAGGFAFIKSQMNPVFHDLSGLRRYVNQPVLGQISMALPKVGMSARHRDVTSFAIAGCALFVVFVAVVALQEVGVEFVRALVAPSKA